MKMPPLQNTSRVQYEAGRRGAGGRAIAIVIVLFLGLTAFMAGVGRSDSGAGTETPRAVPAAPPAQVADVVGSDAAGVSRTRAPDEQVALAGVADLNGDGVPVVCLDPGHGGQDRGFVRPGEASLPTMEEASMNLANALALASRLENHGVVVVMTRRDDSAVNANNDDINGDGQTFDTAMKDGQPVFEANKIGDLDELQARIDVCNRADADLLVSMHINGYDTRTQVRGYEAWYTGCREFGDRSERFASLAFAALGERLAAANLDSDPRGLKNDCIIDVDSSDDSLAHNMIVTGPEVPGKIDPSQMPGAIVESLFVSNIDDAHILASEVGQKAIVAAYEQAILTYFEDNEPAP
ncbi:MAG: N-acetylmuramoyl-L-alanine amidase family protein [Thermomicrobiales bacterium]